MKSTIRSKKFTMGMILFLVIILLLSIFSGYYLNRLSGKTSAILKENHYSVVYARDMSENLININQKIINSVLAHENLDSLALNKEFKSFSNSLELEKNNITEVGEDELASSIETNYNVYRDSVIKFIKSPDQVVMVQSLENKFDILYQQLIQLSQMNVKAIEEKTDDAKVSARNYMFQMTFIGALCFLIAYGYTFMFSSYFNDRFYQLYNGIKETTSSNYHKKVYVGGKDEINEIALIFNEMINKLKKQDHEMIINDDSSANDVNSNELQELKFVIENMKIYEKKASELISKLENKK